MGHHQSAYLQPPRFPQRPLHLGNRRQQGVPRPLPQQKHAVRPAGHDQDPRRRERPVTSVSRVRVGRASDAEPTNGSDGLHLAIVQQARLPRAAVHCVQHVPPPDAPAHEPDTDHQAAGSGAPQPAIAETIACFVKNYDASIHLVANLELFLRARVFLWSLVLWNSWVLLVVYTVFPHERCAQSVFVSGAMGGVELRGDALAGARVSGGARKAWANANSLVERFGELSDVGKMLGARQTIKKE